MKDQDKRMERRDKSFGNVEERNWELGLLQISLDLFEWPAEKM